MREHLPKPSIDYLANILQNGTIIYIGRREDTEKNHRNHRNHQNHQNHQDNYNNNYNNDNNNNILNRNPLEQMTSDGDYIKVCEDDNDEGNEKDLDYYVKENDDNCDKEEKEEDEKEENEDSADVEDKNREILKYGYYY
ncbi:hypothetical protein Glove_396g5 [Diversispora epigaea]|uniref:Uncharacterized protein n=1 Tax=Diversispora epigaea TaxID=1348612 RepID=A0A397H149_9GLOM|nr:hypothetical protein Glove_396g5 [Diversispora epigaea]